MKSKYILLLTLLFGTLTNTHAQKKTSYKEQWQVPLLDSTMLITATQQKELAATEKEMQWYKDAKFGIFVHWGPALSVTTTLSWGRDGERPAANKPADNGIPAQIYDLQYKKFNPVNFNANQWMRQVKEFGANYLVFTAKHHDGFCMFDAPNTDYDIMNTPFQRDIAKELADAAHKHNVKLFWYYSQPDWTHPDCLREKHYENYLPYMKEQVRHLYSNYGKIDGVFWDHLASKYWHWDSYNLIKEMKQLQPGLISNPRSGFGWPIANKRGDFDTPEQSLGPINHSRYWEACLTMTDKWLYNPKGPIKTAEGVLGMLIQVIGNGGNLLLNLGPNDKGEFVEKEASEAVKIGQFMKKYGHTLYGTRRGIYIGGNWGASTQKKNKLYLHILEKIAENAEFKIELPSLPIKIKTIKGITAGLKNYKKENGKIVLYFDKKLFTKNLDNIVELTLAENPEGLKRIKTWHAKPLTKKDFTVSATSFTKSKNHPEIIYDTQGNIFSEGIHLKSWWEPEKKDISPELILNLKYPKKIKTILLSENMRSHSVSDFDIETRNANGIWKKVYNGGVIGEGLRIKLNGKKIYGVKFKINKSSYHTQITAFNIYE